VSSSEIKKSDNFCASNISIICLSHGKNELLVKLLCVSYL
jgi:hypothetical protein